MTKKHGKSFFGYKNHVNADAKHKLIRQYDVTDASVHDSQKFDGLLNQANTSSDVYADSAYRSAETEAKLSLRGLRSRIHHRANRNHPLSQAQENANRQKSRVRARIEHVFGAQQNSPGGRIVRKIGIARAKAKIGLQNLAYNMRRLVTLERMPALSYSGWGGLFAPQGTSRDIITKLNSAAVEALADPAVRSRLVDLGADIFARERQTPEALDALQKADAEKWWPIIKEFGIKAQ